MKPLSEQLQDLSVRAKKAEDDEAAARKEARAKIQARADKLKTETNKRNAKVEAAAVSTKEKTQEQWSSLHKQVKAHNDRIRAEIAATKAEHQAARAERKADSAEDYAAESIAFAYDAIDYAEWAVMDALVARADAEARQ
jgi:hypothetical protein